MTTEEQKLYEEIYRLEQIAGDKEQYDAQRHYQLCYDLYMQYRNPFSARELSMFYFLGRGVVPVNFEKGKQFMEWAVSKNEPHALHDLGCLYFRGQNGYPLDKEKAMDLWKQSAKYGGLKACMALACEYYAQKDYSNTVKYAQRVLKCEWLKNQHIYVSAKELYDAAYPHTMKGYLKSLLSF